MKSLKIKVANMQSSCGNLVPNQFIITTDEAQYFQSYNTIIAYHDYKKHEITLDNNWDYSVTTGRYRNQFLGENKAETRKKIKAGIYKVTNLN